MSDAPQDHQRRPPRERFTGEEHLFDLRAEGDAILQEPDAPRHGHRQITLFRDAGLSILLFDFEAGGWLTDHAADGLVTVQVLTGRIDVTTPEREYPMSPGSLLVLRPGIRHDVRAVSASRMLLTVHLTADEQG